MDYDTPLSEAKFNAGIDIAMEIANYVKQAGYWSQNDEFMSWMKCLEVIERRMYPK